MTTKELIRQEIIRRIKELDEQIVDIYDSKAVLRKDELQRLLSFITTLEEPVSEDLEEAAEQYAIPFNDTTYGVEYSFKGFKAGAEWCVEHFRDTTKMVSDDLEEAAKKYDEVESWRYEALKYPRREAFEAGAEWQKRQMMKDAIDIKVIESYNPTCEPNERLHGISFIYDCKNDNQYLIAGDRAKIIIVKED